jgi:multiple sugar transport system permease protein
MRKWLGAALLFTACVVVVAPFLYMIVTGVMSGRAGLAALPVGRFALTSAIFVLPVVAGQVITSAAAAYAFARLRFAGRDRLFLAYLSTLAAPTILLVIPRYLFIDALGWVDHYRGLIPTEVVSVAGIFLLRQFFRTLPHDLEDAARLEGAGEWTVFRRVVLPQSGPALATLALFAFVEQWRSFLWPLVATQATSMQVMEVGIANLRGLYTVTWPQQMAAAATALAPLLVLLVVARQRFIRGIEWTASGSSVPT